MSTRRRRLAIAITAGVIVLAASVYAYIALTSPIELQAPRPVVTADVANTMPVLPPSVAEAPVLYDLGPAISALERAVPRAFGDIQERRQLGDNKRAHFAYAVERAPFSIRIDGLTIYLTMVAEYEGRGWYKPVIGPELSAACGTGGVARPRFRLTLASQATLTPEWRIRTKTRIANLEPLSNDARDKCRITVFRIDVTQRVLNASRELLESKVADLDRDIANLDTRKRFESWWRKLQLPIRLADSVWLTLNPKRAQLGNVTAEEGTLIANVRLLVQPTVITGPRPNDFALMDPIPPLEHGKNIGEGIHVMLDGLFTYPVATSLLRRALVDKRLEISGRKIRIRDVELSGIGGGRVALGVRLAGDVGGTVYFTGTPRIDTIARQVYVPDLDYDVESSNLLVRGLTFLKGDALRNFLRERARLPDAEAVGRLGDLAERGMNRQLTDGVILRATIDTARGVGVLATTQGVLVRAVADGDLRLAISKRIDVPLKKPPPPSVDSK